MKLLLLLRAGLLKPVFHSESVFMKYRMLLSAYDDLVKLGVSWKNRRKAQVRARGGEEARCEDERFNEAVADYIIEYYEIFKKLYEARFRKIVLSNRTLGLLTRIPGIGIIGAFKIGVVVDDPRRFRNKKHFWSYCGLVRHKRLSGGRSYGKRSPRYRRILKSVFKTAALACSQDGVKNEMNDYFEALIERGKPVWIARHMLARKIASTVLAVMKSGKRYDPDKVNGGC